MGKRALLGVVIAIVFALSTITVSLAFADGEWKDLTSATKRVAGNSLHLTSTAIGPIPRGEAIFDETVVKKVSVGHGWLDLDDDDGDGKISGIITGVHPILGRDSKQNPDSLHTHVIEARPAPNPNLTAEYCLVFLELGDIQSGIRVTQNTIRVTTSLDKTGIDPNSLDTAVAYVIWDPAVQNGPCDDDEFLVKLNSITRGTSVPITSLAGFMSKVDAKKNNYEEIKIAVEFEDGNAEIKVKIGRDKQKFVLEETDRELIIQYIIDITDLTFEEIASYIIFEELH